MIKSANNQANKKIAQMIKLKENPHSNFINNADSKLHMKKGMEKNPKYQKSYGI
jgi:hypothetical protein